MNTVRMVVAAIMVVSCFFFTVAMPRMAVSFDLLGVHLWSEKNKISTSISKQKYYSVRVVSVPGSPEEGAKIARMSSLLVGQGDKPVSSSTELLAKAQADYRRILGALYAEGRYGVMISIKINDREAADIIPGDEFPDHVYIVIVIDCGPQYLFDKVSVRELTQPVKDRSQEIVLLSSFDYIRGTVAKSGKIFQIEDFVIENLRQKGYAKAQIARRDIVADHAIKTVGVDIVVQPGRFAYLGDLTVHNVSSHPRIDSSYITWMTGLKPGQKYDPNALAKANNRLNRLEVFRAAVINEADSIREDGSLPLSLILQERPTRRLGIGAACTTLDGCGFEGYWLHRNLSSHAESLRLDTKISNIGANHNSFYNLRNYSYLLGTAFIRPGVFTPDINYTATMKGQHEVLERYTSTDIYFRSGFTSISSDNFSGYVYLDATHIRTNDDYFGKRSFTAIGLLGGLLYDSRDNKADAHHGFYGETIIEPFYETKYGNFISKITVEGRSYLAFNGYGWLVAAARAKIGAMIGAKSAQLPSSMLFFSGGDGSVRGYTYRNIGIRTNSGDVIGGHSLVEASAEIRVTMTQSVGVVGFIDAGVVGNDIHLDSYENTKIGAGMGMRYKTGMGLIRLDAAVPLNRSKNDPSLGFYIGIGQVF